MMDKIRLRTKTAILLGCQLNETHTDHLYGSLTAGEPLAISRRALRWDRDSFPARERNWSPDD